MALQGQKQLILIADDSEMNRAILTDMLCDEYDILEAEDGSQAVELMRDRAAGISLLLLDINMPVMDGFGVLKEMDANRWIEDIPVIIISAETGAEQIERAYELGASDFITRPFDALIVHKRVVNTLLLYAKQKKLLDLVASQVYETEFQSNMMIDILSHIVEFRNGESGLHIRHVHILTELFLEQLNRKGICHFTKKEISSAGTASALHDIGKIAIPDHILNKPGKLTDEEYAVMKTHTTAGAQMIQALPDFYQDQPLVKMACEICRWHHERYDGRGYPDGLKGDQIPIAAQVVALADVYDALTSPRVYKGPFPHETAVNMILNGECGTFSPMIYECLRELAPAIPDAIREGESYELNHRDLFDVTQELLKGQDLAISTRTLRLLEQERIKNDSFASLSGDLQFEFSTNPPTVTLSQYSANRLGLPEVIHDPFNNDLLFKVLGKNNVYALSDLLRGTTPGQPLVDYDCLLDLDGTKRWYHIMAKATWSDEEPPRYMGAIGKATDVHEDRIRQADLERQASTDPLTGLLNHASARKQIELRLKERHHGKFALALFDLDYFKSANDNRGHMFGDRLLIHLAEKLRRSVRGGDIVARVGGDEFLIFLEHRVKGDPQIAIDRIFAALKGRFEDFDISLSMGVSQTQTVGYDYNDLFHAADNALYTVKRGEKGHYAFYTPEMEATLSAITPIVYASRDSQSGPPPKEEKK